MGVSAPLCKFFRFSKILTPPLKSVKFQLVGSDIDSYFLQLKTEYQKVDAYNENNSNNKLETENSHSAYNYSLFHPTNKNSMCTSMYVCTYI